MVSHPTMAVGVNSRSEERPVAMIVKEASKSESRPAQKAADILMGASSQADAQAAEQVREQGNACFRKQKFTEALQLYTEASQLQPQNPAVWLNRSIANRLLGRWEEALGDAEAVLELQPAHCKALYGKALAEQALGALSDALETCKAGLDMEPKNTFLLQLRSELTQKIFGSDAKQTPTKAEFRGKLVNDDCPTAQLPEADLRMIKATAETVSYRWKGRNPSEEERARLKHVLADMFREKYQELEREMAELNAKKSTLDVAVQYSKEQKSGLQLSGAHRPMPRPERVDLPENHKEPMGVMSVEDLAHYSWENPQRRYMISVYGKVFDVSDRPDKYGPDGPYTELTGVDITWGLFTGIDSEEYTNRFYDLFKAKDQGVDKMAGVCSWLGWYWTEYGEPVGTLDVYAREAELPAPPMEEAGACCMM